MTAVPKNSLSFGYIPYSLENNANYRVAQANLTIWIAYNSQISLSNPVLCLGFLQWIYQKSKCYFIFQIDQKVASISHQELLYVDSMFLHWTIGESLKKKVDFQLSYRPKTFFLYEVCVAFSLKRWQLALLPSLLLVNIVCARPQSNKKKGHPLGYTFEICWWKVPIYWTITWVGGKPNDKLNKMHTKYLILMRIIKHMIWWKWGVYT